MITVGAPYFNTIFLFLGARYSACLWCRAGLRAGAAIASLALAASFGQQLLRQIAAALLAALMSAVHPHLKARIMGALLAASAFWIIGSILPSAYAQLKSTRNGRKLSLHAMHTAHIGVAVLLLGIAGAGVLREEHILYMQPGDEVRVGAYQLRFDGIEQGRGPNYSAERAQFSLNKNGAYQEFLASERRFYPVRGMQTTEAGIRATWFGDVYVAIGAFHEARGQVVRAYFNPLAMLLWVGAGPDGAGRHICSVWRRGKVEGLSMIRKEIFFLGPFILFLALIVYFAKGLAA